MPGERSASLCYAGGIRLTEANYGGSFLHRRIPKNMHAVHLLSNAVVCSHLSSVNDKLALYIATGCGAADNRHVEVLRKP